MSFFSISSGKVIEYLDNGKFICGYVTESQPKRVRLLNQNGRELNLPVSRVVHCSESSHQGQVDREHLVKLLQETTRKRRSLMQAVDLEVLWELTSDEATDTFDPHFLAELSFGCSADDDIVSAFLRSVFNDKLFFKYREGKIKAHSPEQVEQLRIQQEKEAERQILAKSGVILLNRINDQGLSAAPYSETEEEILTTLQQIALHKRMDAAKLKRVLSCSDEEIDKLLRPLRLNGLVKEKAEGVYVINPHVEPLVVRVLKNQELL